MTTPKNERRPGKGGAEDDQHGESNHTHSGLSKGVWYMLEPARLAVHLFGKSEAEIGKWTVSLATALAKGQRRVNPLADELMDERERFIEVRRACGGQRGKGGSSPKVTIDEQGHNPTRPEPTVQPDFQPEPKKGTAPESVSVRKQIWDSLNSVPQNGDLKEIIATLSHEALPQWAVNYCQDADPGQAIGAYKKAIRKIGPEYFRRELDSFVAEVEAGEEPDSLGKAFMARIQALVKAKGERG
jgi:hypothetical protein